VKLTLKIISDKRYDFINFSDFAIFSGKWIKEMGGKIFDETYINGVEDIDVSIYLNKNRENFTFIDYRIGDMVGQSLGKEEQRALKNILNNIYFNEKFREYFNKYFKMRIRGSKSQ
jgi:hypothetical protein